MVSAEGGAIEGLINHSCIVIDFLLKAVSQTLNYVFVCVRVCFTALTESTKSSITHTSQMFGTVAGLAAL